MKVKAEPVRTKTMAEAAWEQSKADDTDFHAVTMADKPSYLEFLTACGGFTDVDRLVVPLTPEEKQLLQKPEFRKQLAETTRIAESCKFFADGTDSLDPALLEFTDGWGEMAYINGYRANSVLWALRLYLRGLPVPGWKDYGAKLRSHLADIKTWHGSNYAMQDLATLNMRDVVMYNRMIQLERSSVKAHFASQEYQVIRFVLSQKGKLPLLKTLESLAKTMKIKEPRERNRTGQLETEPLADARDIAALEARINRKAPVPPRRVWLQDGLVTPTR